EKQSQPEQREDHHRESPADLIGTYYPRARKCCNAGDDGKGRRHAGKKRQSTAAKWLVGTGKYERQNRQDTRADDRQYATDKS
ncbi:MAG: hypothetical protein WBD72_19600, partial [Candidatus Acidiferrum sp.]